MTKKENYLFDNIFAPHCDSDKIFLINDEYEISYLKFNKIVNQIANALVSKGLKVGDRVAVQAEKSVIQIALYVATIKAGGIYLPLNTGYTTNELDYFINDSSSSIVIVDSRIENKLKELLDNQNIIFLTLNGDESGSLNESLVQQDENFDPVDRKKDDLAAILYTSGTTGKSKGAMLSHKNLVSNTNVLKETWRYSSDDTLLHMLPIYHTHGLFVAFNLLAYVNGSIIFLPKFSIQDALKWMKKSTSMMGVPTFYTRLLSDEKFNHDLVKHMRLFISGSAPLLAETHIEFENRTGKKILERYGMTETNMNISNPYDGERKPGTVGLPLSGVEVRIADKVGKELANGEIGIIELRGENIFKGYWQMPNKTKESFRDDGFFITGDMAYIDDNNYVVIVGRDKDLIITGGLNVYPKEVEELIDEIDGVVESAVIAVPHKDFGEAVVSVVVRSNESLSEDDIKNNLREKVAKFKQPKEVFFENELPRNSMGKVQKVELREKFKNIFLN